AAFNAPRPRRVRNATGDVHIAHAPYAQYGGPAAIGAAASAAAKREVASTPHALLPPRRAATTRDAIASPRSGLGGQRRTPDTLQVRAASAWAGLSAGGGGITATTVATCFGSSLPDPCTATCPATYFRTGCNGRQNASVYPTGANSCYCSR